MPASQLHYDLPDPATIPCEQLAGAIALRQQALANTEQAIIDADRRREAADKTAKQWQDLEHAANQDVINDLANRPMDDSGPAFTAWQSKLAVDEAAVRQAHAEGEAELRKGDDALAERQQLHEEQERLRRWLNEARHQQATRCYCETGNSEPEVAAVPSNRPKVLAAAGVAIAATALAVGLLMPSSAKPEPIVDQTPVVTHFTGEPTTPARPHWFYLEMTAVDQNGAAVGGGKFTVKTLSDLRGDKPEVMDDGTTSILSVANGWEGKVDYEPPAGWIVVGSNPSGGQIRVQGGVVDNGYNLGLDKRTGPLGTYYQVVFQVRRPVAVRPPSRPTDGPIGDPHDLDHAPSHTHIGPTTPLGGQPMQSEPRDGMSTGSSSSTSSSSSRCTSNGVETRCETSRGDDGEAPRDGGSSSTPQETSPTLTQPSETQPAPSQPTDSGSGQQVDTYVGQPVITYG
jgi:hypothetical protein